MTADSDEPDRRESFWKRLLAGELPLEHETALFVGVSILDIVMTYTLLAGGGFVESNPIARYFINHWGERGMVYFKMGMTAFVCVLTQIIAHKHLERARFVLHAGILIVSVVVVYSFGLYLRTRGA